MMSDFLRIFDFPPPSWSFYSIKSIFSFINWDKHRKCNPWQIPNKTFWLRRSLPENMTNYIVNAVTNWNEWSTISLGHKKTKVFFGGQKQQPFLFNDPSTKNELHIFLHAIYSWATSGGLKTLYGRIWMITYDYHSS